MDSIEESRDIPFQFHGKALEYFKIWIVNIALSILTLGIYSAWAKVRTKRYFYSNTTLNGSSFSYLADPLIILRGRLIVLGVILLYAASVQFLPLLEFAFIIVYMIALPWIVIKSLQFNTRNSAYRNIRFNFDGKLAEAILVLIGLSILTVVTLGMAFPYFTKRLNQFSIENSYFGLSKFSITATTWDYFRIYLKIFIIPIIGIAAAIAIPAYHAAMNETPLTDNPATLESQVVEPQFDIPQVEIPQSNDPTESNKLPQQISAGPDIDPNMAILASALPSIIVLAFYILIWVYIQTRTANLVYNNTYLDSHEFESTLRVRDMFMLHFVNIIASLISLGLLIPWAKIRLAKYRAEHVTFIAKGDINNFIANESKQVKATGGEFADAFDVDLGF